MAACPCRVLEDNKIEFKLCCEPILKGTKPAATAEELMRARYSAYVVDNMSFVEKTQIQIEGEEFNKEEASQWAQSSEWKGLKIHNSSKGKASDQVGHIEFSAFYNDKKTNTALEHKEKSVFEKTSEGWKFKSGHVAGAMPIKRDEGKVGRNDPCSCGSGKKYKKCCGV
jgi:SEC-C motif-containing protein